MQHGVERCGEVADGLGETARVGRIFRGDRAGVEVDGHAPRECAVRIDDADDGLASEVQRVSGKQAGVAPHQVRSRRISRVRRMRAIEFVRQCAGQRAHRFRETRQVDVAHLHQSLDQTAGEHRPELPLRGQALVDDDRAGRPVGGRVLRIDQPRGGCADQQTAGVGAQFDRAIGMRRGAHVDQRGHFIDKLVTGVLGAGAVAAGFLGQRDFAVEIGYALEQTIRARYGRADALVRLKPQILDGLRHLRKRAEGVLQRADDAAARGARLGARRRCLQRRVNIVDAAEYGLGSIRIAEEELRAIEQLRARARRTVRCAGDALGRSKKAIRRARDGLHLNTRASAGDDLRREVRLRANIAGRVRIGHVLRNHAHRRLARVKSREGVREDRSNEHASPRFCAAGGQETPRCRQILPGEKRFSPDERIAPNARGPLAGKAFAVITTLRRHARAQRSRRMQRKHGAA